MDAQDLTTYFYKGEAVQITVMAKNPDGTVISNTASQTIIFTIGASVGAEPTLSFDDRFSLEDGPTGEYSIDVSDADLTTLVEGKTYFYNIWTKHLTDDPRLQSYGKFVLQKSIAPV
jgi:hypothetical protein